MLLSLLSLIRKSNGSQSNDIISFFIILFKTEFIQETMVIKNFRSENLTISTIAANLGDVKGLSGTSKKYIIRNVILLQNHSIKNIFLRLILIFLIYFYCYICLHILSNDVLTGYFEKIQAISHSA